MKIFKDMIEFVCYSTCLSLNQRVSRLNQSPEIVDKYSAFLGHFTSDCLQDQIPNVDICCDHSTDPLKCAWANAKLFQASQNPAASNQVLLSEAMVLFQKDFVPTNDFIFIIQVLALLYFFWHY